MSHSNLEKELIERIRVILPDPNVNYQLHEPSFIGNEIVNLEDCIRSGWVSSVGSYVDEFESQLAYYTGSKYAVSVMNGTAALHIALIAIGVEENDEVITPTLTFVATANAVSYCKAIPIFADCEEATLGIDADKLDNFLERNAITRNNYCINKNTGRRIHALISMHTFGHPSQIDKIVKICTRWGIKYIEDAAESLGSFYKGRHTGTFGEVSILSFNGNKIITTGGGGAVLTNDPVLAKRIKHLTTTAKSPHGIGSYHDAVGYNYRLPNLNAALGCAQLQSIDKFVQMKRLLAEKYSQVFSEFQGARFFLEPENAKSNYWLNTIILNIENDKNIKSILSSLNSNGIQARAAWTPIHLLPMYEQCPRMELVTAEKLANRIINLPSSPKILDAL